MATTDRSPTGMLALGPVRGAVASLEQVLAVPDLATDLIVIVGDSDGSRGKVRTYRELFGLLGRARRPVLWVPGFVDGRLESDVCRAYRIAQPLPVSRSAGTVLLTPGTPPPGLSLAADELLGELMRTFRPRLAARVERPAVYVVHDHGRPEWLAV